MKEIAVQLRDTATDVKALVEFAKKEHALNSTTVTQLAVVGDLLQRFDQSFRGVRTNAPVSPEGMTTFLAMFHKIGRRGWEALRTFLPLPHEAYLREATRGACTQEGVKIQQLRDFMVDRMTAHKKYRLEDSSTKASAVWDVVLTFDSMHIREMLAYARGHGELRGFTTELTPQMVMQMMQQNFGDLKERVANEWLTFYAIPLVGGVVHRFQVASFAVRSLNASELLKYLRDCIVALTVYGFRVRACVCDGASFHRRLQKRLLTHSEEDLLMQSISIEERQARNIKLSRFKVAFEDPIYK